MSGHAERRRQRVRTSAGGAVYLRIDHLALHGFLTEQDASRGRSARRGGTRESRRAAERWFVPLVGGAEALPPARIAASPIAEQTGQVWSVASSSGSGIEQKEKRQ